MSPFPGHMWGRRALPAPASSGTPGKGQGEDRVSPWREVAAVPRHLLQRRASDPARGLGPDQRPLTATPPLSPPRHRASPLSLPATAGDTPRPFSAPHKPQLREKTAPGVSRVLCLSLPDFSRNPGGDGGGSLLAPTNASHTSGPLGTRGALSPSPRHPPGLSHPRHCRCRHPRCLPGSRWRCRCLSRCPRPARALRFPSVSPPGPLTRPPTVPCARPAPSRCSPVPPGPSRFAFPRSSRRAPAVLPAHLPCLVMIISVWCLWNLAQSGKLLSITCTFPAAR